MPEEDRPGVAGALGRLLEHPVVVVDVGARWGFAGTWDSLEGHATLIGFEPDEAECRRLGETLGSDRLRFEPVGLARRTGLATLYLTRDPACSSLYPPSPQAAARHPALRVIEPAGTATVEVMALDGWCAAAGVPAVDVLKVDTQGSELDVLAGAERTLGAVRAVEVEVEFNELYAGAPLFADVDRYLRSQGFALWRLKDLAYYTQEGTDRSWRTLDACHYDANSYPVPAGPGQLFWANAHYLHASVVHPPAGAGWRQLVRDACITGALGFFDLASRALALAVPAVPPELAGDLELLRADLARRVTGAGAAARAGQALTGTLKLGFGDPAFLGGGWYPPQPYAGAGPDGGAGALRWSGPGRDAWVDVAAVLAPGTRVELLAVAVMAPRLAASLRLEVNGCPVALEPSPHALGTLYAGRLPDSYATPRAFTRLMLRTAEPLPWNRLHPDSQDDSERGVAIAWLRLTGPEERG
jgi:FkbM family methyltransferase